MIDELETDVLILGSGGAGLFAAIHAHRANPELAITIAVKGLLGKCGCTRMVQGGYNAAVHEGDSVERHFMDTIRGGDWIPDQELAWRLVSTAPERVMELENEIGCFFDRTPDGVLHGKPFAGQTFDRTIHKGDLTGIEIVNRLSEQVWALGARRLEDHRAVELIPPADGGGLSGVLLIDMRTGKHLFVKAKAVLLATGGGPTMYRFHSPSGDKACDGLAMALRNGLSLRDMEMVQFHPTGLLAGPHTRLTGTVLEEGLRGAGGHLLDGNQARFMPAYDERGERATRDIVSRAMFSEIGKGSTSPNGGLFLKMSHLGPDFVRREFKGMVTRCADAGFDLAGGLVEVIPTAHYLMGGVEMSCDCETAIPGLFAAGEDTGGVHGANRLGGNGVANATVFGGIAGGVMAEWVARNDGFGAPDRARIEDAIESCDKPFRVPGGDLNEIRERLMGLMWRDAGIIRTKDSLGRAASALEDLAGELDNTGVPQAGREFNLTWHDWLNLQSQITVSRSIVAAAQAREESRGAHYREDYPDPGDLEATTYTRVSLRGGTFEVRTAPVAFTRVRPGESLIAEDAPPPESA